MTADDHANALPPGTRMGNFEMRRVIGAGGFGIVYLAFDHALEREVAVKEYMPMALAGRTETLHVSLHSRSDREVFELGLASFVKEAKLLASLDHPALIKVLHFWQAHDTAYMAMPLLRGRTLKALRTASERAPTERMLHELLQPLLAALSYLHDQGIYHRDISPDNIHIGADGRPMLLDFGAARRVIGDKSQALTAILKPAYSPIEQYGTSQLQRQGPWTDLYALGATLYFLITGRQPPACTDRIIEDRLPPLAGSATPGIGTRFLEGVDWMMALRPEHRPQSVKHLHAVWAGEMPLPAPSSPHHGAAGDAPAAAGGGLAAAGPARKAVHHELDHDRTRIRPVTTPVSPAGVDTSAPDAQRPAARRGARRRLFVLGGTAACALPAAAWWWRREAVAITASPTAAGSGSVPAPMPPSPRAAPLPVPPPPAASDAHSDSNAAATAPQTAPAPAPTPPAISAMTAPPAKPAARPQEPASRPVHGSAGRESASRPIGSRATASTVRPLGAPRPPAPPAAPAPATRPTTAAAAMPTPLPPPTPIAAPSPSIAPAAPAAPATPTVPAAPSAPPVAPTPPATPAPTFPPAPASPQLPAPTRAPTPAPAPTPKPAPRIHIPFSG